MVQQTANGNIRALEARSMIRRITNLPILRMTPTVKGVIQVMVCVGCNSTGRGSLMDMHIILWLRSLIELTISMKQGLYLNILGYQMLPFIQSLLDEYAMDYHIFNYGSPWLTCIILHTCRRWHQLFSQGCMHMWLGWWTLTDGIAVPVLNPTEYLGENND